MKNKDPKQMQSKLEKMKMPEKRKADQELDLSSLGGPEDFQDEEGSPDDSSEAPDDSNEHMDEQAPSDGEQRPSNAALEASSDDELMAEVEKRGLVKKLEESEGEDHNSPDDDSQDMYS